MGKILLALGMLIGLMIVGGVIGFALYDGFRIRIPQRPAKKKVCKPENHSWYVPDNASGAVCRVCDEPGPLVIPAYLDPVGDDAYFIRQQWNDAQPSPKDVA